MAACCLIKHAFGFGKHRLVYRLISISRDRHAADSLIMIELFVNASLPISFQGFEYSRSGNPTRNCLEKAVAALDGAKYSKSERGGWVGGGCRNVPLRLCASLYLVSLSLSLSCPQASPWPQAWPPW